MEGESAKCAVCENFKKPLVCPLCAYNAINTDHSSLRELHACSKRNNELQGLLLHALDAQGGTQGLARRLAALKNSLQAAKQRAKAGAAKALQVKAELKSQRASFAQRQQQLQTAQEKVQTGQRALDRNAAADSKQTLLHLHLLQDQLAAELRRQAKTLYLVLPFTVNIAGNPSSRQDMRSGVDTAGVGTSLPSSQRSLQVTIGGNVLPESLTVPPGANRQKLSTALGNLVLLVEVLSGMLGTPLLHSFQFCGSTSKLWYPRSFWEDKRARSSPIFRLYHATTIPAPSAPQGPATVESLAGNALAAVKQHWPFENHFSRTPKVLKPQQPVSDSRQEECLRAAILQLNRSTGLMCRDPLLNQLGLAPQDWPPLATLAGFCMQLAAHPRTDSRRSMTASVAVPPTLREVERSMLTDTFDMDGEDDQEEVDGWDVIHRPAAWSGPAPRTVDTLPPRPDENEEAISHWERAMIIDSSEHSVRRLGHHRLLLDQIAPLRQGAYTAAEKLWNGLRRG